jgi:hypothetical protein
VGSVPVVVLDVFVKDSPEVATTLNQGPVEALVTHGTNEPFGEGVGFRGTHLSVPETCPKWARRHRFGVASGRGLCWARRSRGSELALTFQ